MTSASGKLKGTKSNNHGTRYHTQEPTPQTVPDQGLSHPCRSNDREPQEAHQRHHRAPQKQPRPLLLLRKPGPTYDTQKDPRALAEAVDEAEGGPLVGVEPGDGGNRALVRGIVQGRDFDQAPAEDAEDIAEASADGFSLGGVELTLPREADAENQMRSQGRIG
jgi:hypothetical protein